ncbi:MAG: C1 family peptidase [Candidatus Competibacteraceae bacterium]
MTNEMRFTPIAAAVMAATLLAMPLLGSGGVASAQEGPALLTQKQAGFRWQITVEPAPDASRMTENAATELSRAGVRVNVANDQLTLEGQENITQLQTVLFDTAGIDFLSGQVDLKINMPATGESITLNLQARTTTGYLWKVVPGEEASLYTQDGEATFAMRSRGLGVPALQTIKLNPTGKGNTVVNLRYQRPFERNAPVHTKLSVWMPKAGDVELSDPKPAELLISETDFRASQSRMEPNAYAQLLPKALPTSWDWRTQGIVPAVRDQGSCGSCWAFGTVGAMEAAIKKGGGPLTDLSEQFLVSCNTDGGSCEGGWTAHKYHYNILGTNQTVAGAVLESASPYTATNGSCTTSYAHPYKLSNWAFVAPEWNMPTVDQIKNAIYTYGPVTAAVCADSGWSSYTSGVYKPTSNDCPWNGQPSINHLIVLVGWDDATSSWILRNSWGPNWGENGYMHIAWDPTGATSHVGGGTSWVKYQAATPTVPILYSPTGNITTLKPAYSWSRVGTAASYKLQVYDTAAVSYPINMIVSSSYCNATTNRCSYTPSVSLTSNKGYQWRAAAGSGAFSSWMNFSVSSASSGFNSQFNGSSTGWVARPGGPWAVTSAVYYTNGVANKWSNTSYNANFNNFTYTVRMKRADTSGNGYSSGLIVRGLPISFDSTNRWNNAYQFLYTQYGNFSVLKSVGGVTTALKSQTTTSSIVRNNWNTLKVVANGSQLRFYINNVLVWTGSDSSLISGQVGLAMSRGATVQSLQVDWATLGPVTAASYEPAEMIEADQQELPDDPSKPSVPEHSR